MTAAAGLSVVLPAPGARKQGGEGRSGSRGPPGATCRPCASVYPPSAHGAGAGSFPQCPGGPGGAGAGSPPEPGLSHVKPPWHGPRGCQDPGWACAPEALCLLLPLLHVPSACCIQLLAGAGGESVTGTKAPTPWCSCSDGPGGAGLDLAIRGHSNHSPGDRSAWIRGRRAEASMGTGAGHERQGLGAPLGHRGPLAEALLSPESSPRARQVDRLPAQRGGRSRRGRLGVGWGSGAWRRPWLFPPGARGCPGARGGAQHVPRHDTSPGAQRAAGPGDWMSVGPPGVLGVLTASGVTHIQRRSPDVASLGEGTWRGRRVTPPTGPRPGPLCCGRARVPAPGTRTGTPLGPSGTHDGPAR